MMNKLYYRLSCIILLICLVYSCNHWDSIEAEYTGDKVIAAPSWAPPFYKKYIDAAGLPILSSEKAEDKFLKLCRKILLIALSKRADIHRELVANNAIFVIRAKSEKNSDHPDFKDTKGNSQDTDDGLAGDAITSSVSLIAELDKYSSFARVTIHELSHVVHNIAIRILEGNKTLNEIDDLFKEALDIGYFKKFSHIDSDSYTQVDEFIAGMTEIFFNLPERSEEFKSVNNRDDIKSVHPKMYDFLSRYFPVVDIDLNKLMK